MSYSIKHKMYECEEASNVEQTKCISDVSSGCYE